MLLKYPGPVIGAVIGAVIGHKLGKFMVTHGFPGWGQPAMTIAFAVKTAQVVKNYFDSLKG